MCKDTHFFLNKSNLLRFWSKISLKGYANNRQSVLHLR